jgi:hypothetical protein
MALCLIKQCIRIHGLILNLAMNVFMAWCLIRQCISIPGVVLNLALDVSS